MLSTNEDRVRASAIQWRNYIDGAWVCSDSGREIDVLNPATGKLFARIRGADGNDVDRAVSAARAAVRGRVFYEMSPHDRMLLLFRIAQELRALAGEIVSTLVGENGKAVSVARDEVECAAQYFEYYGGIADKVFGKSIPLGRGYVDYTQCVPYGVTAHIVPWNFPLEIAARSVAPALACGNAVIVKSPELSPLSVCFLAEACERAKVPRGYFNLLAGFGSDVGEALVSHTGIDQLVFTGSVETGRRLLHHAAEKIIPMVAELGGKSAAIVYADADIPAVVNSAAIGIFAHGGQICSAGSRLLVHHSIHDELVQSITKWIQTKTMGPGSEDHFFTPLISSAQREKVEGFVLRAEQDGAKTVAGGRRPDDRPGFYMQPTVLTDVTMDMEIGKREVFGPVLAVFKFSEPEEALAIANSSDYGLAAGVYTKDLSRAHWTADRLEAGTVFINQWFAGGNETPFGGFKKSGYGREKGVEAMANYQQTRNIAIRL
jgi:aldehyde dehydrogenase (NAD+)/betaine-aldehyde dehydrogenase